MGRRGSPPKRLSFHYGGLLGGSFLRGTMYPILFPSLLMLPALSACLHRVLEPSVPVFPFCRRIHKSYFDRLPILLFESQTRNFRPPRARAAMANAADSLTA